MSDTIDKIRVGGVVYDADLAPAPDNPDTPIAILVNGKYAGMVRWGAAESYRHIGRHGGLSAFLTECIDLSEYGYSLMCPSDQALWMRLIGMPR